MQISFSPIFGFPYYINGDGTFFGSQATFETKLLYASQYWQAAKIKNIWSHNLKFVFTANFPACFYSVFLA
jgi:hypothetical protein